jgi:hypothetical protein
MLLSKLFNRAAGAGAALVLASAAEAAETETPKFADEHLPQRTLAQTPVHGPIQDGLSPDQLDVKLGVRTNAPATENLGDEAARRLSLDLNSHDQGLGTVGTMRSSVRTFERLFERDQSLRAEEDILHLQPGALRYRRGEIGGRDALAIADFLVTSLRENDIGDRVPIAEIPLEIMQHGFAAFDKLEHIRLFGNLSLDATGFGLRDAVNDAFDHFHYQQIFDGEIHTIKYRSGHGYYTAEDWDYSRDFTFKNSIGLGGVGSSIRGFTVDPLEPKWSTHIRGRVPFRFDLELTGQVKPFGNEVARSGRETMGYGFFAVLTIPWK